MSAPRIVAIGDLHWREDARQAQREAALQALLASQGEVDAWLYAGDVVEGRTTPSERRSLAAMLRAYADRAPVIIVCGNHDPDGELDCWPWLRTAWPIEVVSTPQVVRVRLARAGGSLSVAVVPYPSLGGLLARGVVGRDQADQAEAAMTAILRSLGAELDRAAAAGDATLYLGHHLVGGTIADSGPPLLTGREIAVSLAQLRLIGPRLAILGHVHRPQEVAPGVHYVGSVVPESWAERHQPRALVIALGERPVVESVPLPVPRAWSIDVTWSSQGDRLVMVEGQDPETIARWASDHWADCEVRVRVHLAASDLRSPEAAIRGAITTAQRLQIERVVRPDRPIRAPAVAQARSIAAKLAAMEPDGALPPDWPEKLAWLEETTDEALLIARVRARLTEGPCTSRA